MAQGSEAVARDMRTTATAVDNMSSETQAELKRLQGEAQSLRQNWTSTHSGKSFDQTMQQWNDDAAAIHRAMLDMAKLLRVTADRYDQLERDNAAAVRAGDGQTRTYHI